MSKPVVIDLCCGLGGWSKGFIAEGWDAIGFDVERHEYGDKKYPGHLILKDVLTLNGYELKAAVNPALIVASPPCQKYSHMAMPFSRGKREASWQRWERDSEFGDFRLNDLFNACFRIARECGVPIILENVKGAQPWVGSAKWHYGSYYLWGDVPALMPHTLRTVKVEGFNFHQHEETGKGGSFQSAAVAGLKNGGGGSWFGIGSPGQTQTMGNPVNGTKTVGHANIRDGHSHTRHLTNQRESDAVKVAGINWSGHGKPGYKAQGFNVTAAQRYRAEHADESGTKVSGDWFGSYAEQKAAGTISPGRLHGKNSDSRKAASALIAEIPFDLAQWIARCFKP